MLLYPRFSCGVNSQPAANRMTAAAAINKNNDLLFRFRFGIVSALGFLGGRGRGGGLFFAKN